MRGRYESMKMKKTLFSLMLVAASLVKSQEAVRFTPDSGSWGLGVDATNLIKNFTFVTGGGSQAVFGKYFVSQHLAYRGAVRLGFNNFSVSNRVTDRLSIQTSTVQAYPAAWPTKENSWTRNSFVLGVSGGMEKRRGTGRLQGVYGLEGNLYFSSTKETFKYGNALNASNSTPVNVEAADAMVDATYGAASNIDGASRIQGIIGDARVLSRKSGLKIGVGARAFVGAEYFFLPKMSLGGEFGWSVGYMMQTRSATIVESIGQSTVSGSTGKSVRQTTLDGAPSSYFYADNENGRMFGGATASLRLMIYF